MSKTTLDVVIDRMMTEEIEAEHKALAAAQAAGAGYLCVAIQENIDRLLAR